MKSLKQKQKVSRANIMGLGSTMVDSIIFTKENFKYIAKISLVIILFDLLIWVTSKQTQSIVIQSIFALLSFCALFWVVNQRYLKKNVSIKTAYLDGTSRFLSFLLVVMFQAVALLPIFITSIAYVLSVSIYELSYVANALFIFINILSLILTLFLISKLIFAGLLASITDFTPSKAIAESWKLSRGNFASLALRIVILGIFIGLVMYIVNLLFTVIPFTDLTYILIEEITINLLVLPFSFVYIFNLYKQLSKQ